MTRSITILSLLRLVACIAALSLTLVGGARVANAGTDAVDDGASGGNSSGSADTGLVTESPVLVGSSPEREEVVRDDTPILVGSGADREIVATQAEVVVTSDAELLRGAYSPVVTDDDAGVAATNDALIAQTTNQRSIARSEDKLTDDGHLAGWDDVAATEAAAAAAPEQPAWVMTDNERSIALIESTFAPGGHLAGWDDIAASETVAGGGASEAIEQ
jgi:hypothetical protein